MTITLTVSEVRQALQQAAGRAPSGDGAPSTALLGTIFHRVIGELLRDDSPLNLESVVRDLDADLVEWQRVLVEHTYDQLLGPMLTNQSGSLREHGDQVLDLWTAVQDAVHWLAELWWQITEKGTKSASQSDSFWVERQVVLDLQQPHWSESVALLGQTDAVLRHPTTNAWCVLEWKIGQTSPAIDLAQVCLYHLMLNGLNQAKTNSAIAVVSFLPGRHETLFQSTQIADAQARLLDLIGRTAGVIDEPPQPKSTVPTVSTVLARQPEHLKKEEAEKPAAKNGTQKSGPSEEWLSDKSNKILRVLKKFGMPCRECRPPLVGPAFVRFSLFPDGGIRQRKVMAAAPELHLHLGLPAEPVMTVVEGTIAIDLPNPNPESVPFSSIIPYLTVMDSSVGSSRIPVGMDIGRKLTWCDLASSESPHMLVIGTPGSGKSQWLRVAVASLMHTNKPETLQLLLIDPKQNAFTFAAGSPFLQQPIVVPGGDGEVSEILEGLVETMGERYTLLAQEKCQSMNDYVRKTGQTMPRMICICDEYADLLHGSNRTEKQAIEKQLKRISAKGRAAGIHLILATQQAKATVITTGIRAMLPAKVALRVSTAIESRVAIEESGAERLLGNGDLLFKLIGTQRLQGAWLPDNEESLAASTVAVQ
ncbi:MAG: DNA translocase FtsK [Planctomyces sp.]|jgi:S-DNA-T family DNA segregation ATPase FtsK/SpoIIIE